MVWEWSIDGWILLAGVLSACSCALVGNFLVLRKLSLMGDAISHAVLPGLVIAFIVTNSRASLPMFVGAVIVGVLTAFLTQVITRHGKVEHGAAMGVVFSILFAFGLVLIRRAPGADHVDLDPECVLLGNMMQIGMAGFGGMFPTAITNLLIVMAANILFVGLFYKELRICAFDPELATSLGIPASVMHYALMVMVAITTIASFEAVGSILVIAMLIVPAVTAHLLADRLGAMIFLSLIAAAVSAVMGHVLAMFGPGWLGMKTTVASLAETSPMTAETSAMMAVVAGALLLAAVLFSPEHGLLGRAYHRFALATRIVGQDVLGWLYRGQEAGKHVMMRTEVIRVIGRSWQSRWALRRLQHQGLLDVETHESGEAGLRLTQRGRIQAERVVGSHRLWESYMSEHFDLADDHLHEPANRMEHFITPELQDELRRDVPDATRDPHGKPVPPLNDSLLDDS